MLLPFLQNKVTFNEESAISKKILGIISRFGISISQEIRQKGITPKTAGIRTKMALLVILAILAVSLLACSSPSDKQVGGVEIRPNPQPVITILKDCTYLLQINYQGDLKDFSQVIQNYYDNDLTLARDFLLRTYGLRIGPMLKYPSLTILPPRASIVGISKQKNCPDIYVDGVTIERGISLVNSSTVTRERFIKTFAHEIGHEIHYKVREKHPEFNEKWAMIKGGYAYEIGMDNQVEDIATVFDTAMINFISNKDLRQIQPIDNNYEAFYQKLRLLKEYGFFPDALKVPFVPVRIK